MTESLYNPFRKRLAASLGAAVGKPVETLEGLLEVPPDPAMGDYSFPCFTLAKELRKAPPAIAAELASRIAPDDVVQAVRAVGGYVNFDLNAKAVLDATVGMVLEKGDAYGGGGQGGVYLLDYSSPNIAKPFHVGHLRGTVMGNSLRRMLDHLGNQVVSINHLGDWGTQFGLQIWGYWKWGDEVELVKDPINYLVGLYVKTNQMAEKDPTVLEEARAIFRRLENGDEEVLALWKRFRELSLESFMLIYDLLGVKFDSYAGEAFYVDKTEAAIERLRERGLVEESDGAQVVKLDHVELPPALLRKSDGATLYLTRDIAAAFYRIDTYAPTKMVYVVGAPQKLHLRQLGEVLARYDARYKDLVFHVDFGHYRLPTGSMSTRQGQTISLESLIEEAKSRALQIIEEKNPELEDKQAVALKVALAGIIFADLSTDRVKDVIFEMDRMVRFEGDTGPYLQFGYVRTQGILRKAEGWKASPGIDLAPLTHPFEKALALQILKFRGALEKSARELKPSHLANQLLDIGKALSRFLDEVPVLKSEGAVREARLALTAATGVVLKRGLWLLGIECPDRM